MQFILLIIISAIIFFVVIPAVRVYMTVRRAQKQAREFFDRGSNYNSKQNRRNPHQHQREKKIDPDVGEYVDFEEIASYSDPSSSYAEKVDFKAESQIEDAEWEDVK